MSILQITPNLEHCHPRLTASLRPGFVRLYCEKNGSPALRLQTRHPGGAWHLLIDEFQSDSLEDHTPVEIPGREEVREYRALAVFEGEEVGQPSEIVTVNLPG